MPDRCRGAAGWLPVGAAALPVATTTTHDRTAELLHMVKPDNRGRSLKRAAAAPPRVVRRTNALPTCFRRTAQDKAGLRRMTSTRAPGRSRRNACRASAGIARVPLRPDGDLGFRIAGGVSDASGSFF